ncbi:MAG: HypC/HybG/HupF family hydrogenase formation chaperone [Candidatus Helarchaeales archaeon]
MCLAIPAKIIEIIDDTHARVEIAGTTTREISTGLVKANIGDYVIVHAGYAIEVMRPDEALKTLEDFKEIMEIMKEEDEKNLAA